MRLKGYGATDTGRVRDHNEDAFLVDDAHGLYGVADGVGGHNAGEVASAMLVRHVQAEGATLKRVAATVDGGGPVARRRLVGLLPQLLDHASEGIYRHSRLHPECQGMATTGVFLLASGRSAFVVTVGDSRCYLLRGDRLLQVSEDHTLVCRLVKEGHMSPEEAQAHPQRNVIIRSVGIGPGVDCDTVYLRMQPRDLFLLCSDGLTDMVEDREILDLALRYRDEALVAALVQRANARGGRDNITVVVLEVEEEEDATTLAPRPGRFDLFEKLEFLESIFMFKDLTVQERIKVNRCLFEQRFPPGHPIVTLGEEGDELFIVVDGTCVVEKHGIVLAEVGPGGYFGELAFLSKEVRSATVRAKDGVTCYVIARDDLHQLLYEDSVLGNKLLWAFLENLGHGVKTLNIENAKLKARLAGKL